ncbi:MAG: LysR family transcriptional regulator [Synergistaceae bacterium]|nr:LysR family transcriptional regulator [Synergistaceae bacterium]
MEFKQIESFVTVAQKKSFTKAADTLFMSQPAVTSNIQKLEKELGIKLIDRKAKNITLTEGGNIFYRYAVEMINLCAQAEYSLNEYNNNIKGTIEIYASTIPEQYLLPYIVKGFNDIYPLVLFSIRHKDSKEVVDEILSGKINFGFVGAKYPSEALQYIDFYDDTLVLIASPQKNYISDSITINKLAGEKIIIREEGSGTRHLIENALKKKRLHLNMFKSEIICDSLESIKKMVALDLGISFVSDIAVKCEVTSGYLNKYTIEDLDLHRHFSLVFSNNRNFSPVEEKFKDFVRSWNWDQIFH